MDWVLDQIECIPEILGTKQCPEQYLRNVSATVSKSNLMNNVVQTVVKQNLLRSLILQKYPAGSEAGAGSEAMSEVLFVTEAGAPVKTEEEVVSLPYLGGIF